MIQTAELQSTMPRSSCRYLESQVWIGWPLNRDKQRFISSGHINYLSVPAVLKYLLSLEKYLIRKVLLLFRTESNTILAVILLWAVILVVCVPVFLSHGLVLVTLIIITLTSWYILYIIRTDIIITSCCLLLVNVAKVCIFINRHHALPVRIAIMSRIL